MGQERAGDSLQEACRSSSSDDSTSVGRRDQKETEIFLLDASLRSDEKGYSYTITWTTPTTADSLLHVLRYSTMMSLTLPLLLRTGTRVTDETHG